MFYPGLSIPSYISVVAISLVSDDMVVGIFEVNLSDFTHCYEVLFPN